MSPLQETIERLEAEYGLTVASIQSMSLPWDERIRLIRKAWLDKDERVRRLEKEESA